MINKMLKPRGILALFTGCLFAAYSAYNVFIIFRDIRSLPGEGILISAIVALMFVILAAFAFTAGVKGKKHVIFMSIRRSFFLFAMLVLIALKIRLIDRIIEYFDYTMPYTVLYDGAYFLTVAGFLILFIYYTFILRTLPFHPRAAVVLPVTAIVLFFLSLILEAILFFVYGLKMEANTLRTLVMRPVFYFGFIGLSLHFLYPLQPTFKAKKTEKNNETDN